MHRQRVDHGLAQVGVGAPAEPDRLHDAGEVVAQQHQRPLGRLDQHMIAGRGQPRHVRGVLPARREYGVAFARQQLRIGEAKPRQPVGLRQRLRGAPIDGWSVRHECEDGRDRDASLAENAGSSRARPGTPQAHPGSRVPQVRLVISRLLKYQ